MAETVVTLNGKKVKTVNGAEVTVSVGAEGVKVDNAKVVTTDIVCDNGVIHVIDSVIIPKAAPAKVAAFDPKKEAGVSGPFGFFDPLGICPSDKKDFMKYRGMYVLMGRGGTIVTCVDTYDALNCMFIDDIVLIIYYNHAQNQIVDALKFPKLFVIIISNEKIRSK